MDKLTAGAAESSWQGFCGAFEWREAARRLPSISITKNAAGPARNRFLRHFPLFHQIFNNLHHMVRGEAELLKQLCRRRGCSE